LNYPFNILRKIQQRAALCISSAFHILPTAGIKAIPSLISIHPRSSNIKNHIRNLDDITFKVSSNPSSSIVISDASIKNHVATLILYIYSHNKLIIKTIHQAVNVIATKAKLFAMQCDINQAIGIPNINHIIVITDSLHTAKRIFDFSLHLYQIYSCIISHKLREFFLKDSNNCIKFWDCPSKQNWCYELKPLVLDKRKNLVLD